MKSLMFGSRAEKRDKTAAGTDVPADDDKASQPNKLQNKPSFFGLFASDKRQSSEVPTEADFEEIRMNVIRALADTAGLPCVPDAVLENTFNSVMGDKNVDKTVHYLKIQNMAVRGEIQPYDSNVTMKGARNRQGVTCYLDALLFAMFAKLNAFEYMLQGNPEDENKRNLAVFLRAWVNMLRSGDLIETDLTALIQNSLAKCGWKEADLVKQQDTSEAFSFITETLELPLLRLQVDLYHNGQNDDADHRFVEERLLNIAVPSVEDGGPVRLEDCLMDYFNSQVEVQRQDVDNDKKSPPEAEQAAPTNDEAKSDDGAAETPAVPLARVRSSDSTNVRLRAEIAMKHSHPIRRSHTLPVGDASTATEDGSVTRRRSLSLIQRVKVDEDGKVVPAPVSRGLSPVRDLDTDDKSFTNVITLPAWQVFRWIPWYSPDKQEPTSDADVVRNFNQRPVIGICLKRYQYHEDGTITKVHTEVDIPDSLRLPHIIAEGSDTLSNTSSLSTEYKLVLQSVVSHQGQKFDEGHYVSFARVAPKILTENRRHESDPPPDYEEAQWVKFDDLKPVDNKVVAVDDIKEALKAETPYMLFYQIVPVMDDSLSAAPASVLPPSYKESKPKLVVTPCGPSDAPYDRIMVSTDPPEKPKPKRSASRNGPCCTPGADYFPVFSKAGDAADTDYHNPINAVPSPRPSGESIRGARPSLDVPTEKPTRTSGQYTEASRPATSNQMDSGTGSERGTSGRFGFGRAVVRFSRSASRHSRSSSHSAALTEEHHSPFASDSRKSISLSNLTRGFGNKESSKEVPREKAADVVSGAEPCAVASSPVVETQPRIQESSEQRDVLEGVASKDSGGGSSAGQANGPAGVEHADVDQASPENTETDAATAKRRRRRGKKRADGQDDDRQCLVM